MKDMIHATLTLLMEHMWYHFNFSIGIQNMNYKKTALCLLLLVASTQSFSMDKEESLKARNEEIATFFEDCLSGNVDQVEASLKKDISLLNAEADGVTPLFMACLKPQPAVIFTLLAQNSIKANKKSMTGFPPLFATLTIDLKESTNIDTIHSLLTNKKINIHKKNDYNQTFFYTAYTGRFLSEKYNNYFGDNYQNNANLCLKLIEKFGDEEKKCFLTTELYQAASLYTSMPAEVYDETGFTGVVSSFIFFCIEHGGDINARDSKKRRPIDKAYAKHIRHLKYPGFPHREVIYHAFVINSLYINDEELHYLLWTITHNNDVFAKIMGYYVAFTIDREIAKSQSNLQYFQNTPTVRKRVRQTLLNSICEKYSYINPYDKKFI